MGLEVIPLSSPARRFLCRCVSVAILVLTGVSWGQETRSGHRAARFLRGRAGDVPVAEAMAEARRVHGEMLAAPRSSTLSAAWTALGPGQVATAAYGNVTGRVTAIAVDPADATGNTLYVGTTGGGVWKSVNAAGPVAAVSFVPLTDTLPVFSGNAGTSALPSLSIGALGLGNGVLLAGTGDTNDATDSYYGSGILRSVDGGVTWTLIPGSRDGVAGNHSFFGLGFAGFAFSGAAPSLVVAAVGRAAEGDLVNAASALYSVAGLYYSTDAGVTWQIATLKDGSQTVQDATSVGGNPASAVVWNPVRQKFYAAVQFHGYYESTDGATWTRLQGQPGSGLTAAACPAEPGQSGSPGCPIFRGALAVQPVSGDMFALSVDAANGDQGLWLAPCSLQGASCASDVVLWSQGLASTPLEAGGGSHAIPQGDYNLTLAAAGSGTDTLVYVGTVDLYRCSLAGGCVLRNTTNAENACLAPAKVAGAQHAIAAVGGTGLPLVYLGNDGGLWRSTDGVNETATVCSFDDANHFENLNGGFGSLAEVVSLAQDPVDPAKVLVGLGANGTAGTASASSASWPQLATGEGGTVAIDAANPSLWYVSTDAGVSIARCTSGAGCTAADFAGAATIGEAQVGSDPAAVDAPWLLDPALTAELVVGTCRVWRGPAESGSLWSDANAISRPFGAATASACSTSFPVVRSLSAGGAASGATAAQNAGSTMLYAGLAGTLDGGGGLGGHVFGTAAAATAGPATVWTDLARSPVTNDVSDQHVFNPGGFDVSSVTADPHDATGATVYATVMGFAGNGTNAPHVYRSADAGAHWANVSSNLPNAPANALVVDPIDANTVYVAMDTGVYVTTQVGSCTGGNCWSVYGNGLPNAPAVTLQAAAGMATGDGRTGELRVGTYGRGIWQIPLLTAVSPAAPAIAVNPTALVFATQQVGTASASQTVTVTNTGNAPLVVSSLAANGDFTATGNCVAGPVAAGGSCTVQVTFLPTQAGPRPGVLTVYANVLGGQATVQLSGTGSPPAAVVLNPITLTFPSTVVGAHSAVENITVSNLGGTTTALQVPSVSGDFMITANTCGASLAPGTGCTVSVVFTPTGSGMRSGSFVVVDAAGTQTASLLGVGTSPATDALAPLSLTFGSQQLNTASSTQPVTLTNAGDAPLTLIAGQITSGDFTVVNGCGNSLNGHSSCTLNVAFVPKAVGAESGTLTVSDQFRMQTVVLNGVGVAPAGVSVSPVGGVGFGAVAVGTTSGAQTVTVTNNGGVSLMLSGVVTSGDFAVAAGTNTCPGSLAVGTACTLGVVFAPMAGGARTGTLTLTDSAASSPQSLTLTGTGVDFTLAPDGPTSITVASGGTAVYALLLSSGAGVPGVAGLTCSGQPVHTTCVVAPSSVMLGSTTLVTVTITTGLAGARVEAPGVPWMWTGVSAISWAGLVPLGLALRRRRRRRRRRRGWLLGLVLLAGCGSGRLIPGDVTGSGGGGTTTPVTPQGSSTILVSASSAGLVRSVSLTLVVQ